MLPSLGRAREESEAATDSVPVPSRKGMGKLWNHLQNSASRTWYLEVSDMEPAGTCSSLNAVICYLRLWSPCHPASVPGHPSLLTCAKNSRESIVVSGEWVLISSNIVELTNIKSTLQLGLQRLWVWVGSWAWTWLCSQDWHRRMCHRMQLQHVLWHHTSSQSHLACSEWARLWCWIWVGWQGLSKVMGGFPEEHVNVNYTDWEARALVQASAGNHMSQAHISNSTSQHSCAEAANQHTCSSVPTQQNLQDCK